MNIRKLIISTSIALSAAIAAAADAPRYIFYFIGDGMGNGPVQAAQQYRQQILGNPDGLSMLTFPVVGQATTYSTSSPVTDSAAAGTALATGVKTRNGMLGMSPDTVAVNSIAKVLHDRGWGVGLVTTVAPDDATPGAFYAHVPNRKQYYEIGRQFIDSGYEFLAGSSLRGTTTKKGEPTDLLKRVADAGIQLVYKPDSIDSARNRRVILLEANPLNSANVGYTVDSVPGQNTLPMMTRAAIEHLTAVSPDSFFLMIEGGNIDHALHANDAAGAIMDIDQMDRSLDIALEFMAAHPDETLIVVTADHDTGGMSVGNEAVGYHCYPEVITTQHWSKDRLSDHFEAMMRTRRNYEWSELQQLLSESLGLYSAIEVTPEEDAKLHQAYTDVVNRVAVDQTNLYSTVNHFIAAAVDLLNSKAGYGFTSFRHTGNPVPVMAIGNGAEVFSSWNNNTQIPEKIFQILNLPHPNAR